MKQSQMTSAQKDALASYLAVYKTQLEKDPEFDQFSLYFPMYCKATEQMRRAGFTQSEIDETIIYRREMLAKLTAI